MYTHTLGEIRESFWKTFGRYMALVPSASGERINWINYKTGSKTVRFVLDIGNQSATVAVTVGDPAVFEKLIQLRAIFISFAGDEWKWGDGCITVRLAGKDVRRQEEWPELISFFKDHLVALHAFWTEIKDVLY